MQYIIHYFSRRKIKKITNNWIVKHRGYPPGAEDRDTFSLLLKILVALGEKETITENLIGQFYTPIPPDLINCRCIILMRKHDKRTNSRR